MKKLFALVACLSMVGATAAFAGNSTSGSTSTAATASTANNAGNSQSISSYSFAPSTQTVREVPPVSAPSLAATLTGCFASSSMGAGGPGWGASFGSTRESKECNIREDAALMEHFNQHDLAYQIACESKIIREADAKTEKRCK